MKKVLEFLVLIFLIAVLATTTFKNVERAKAYQGLSDSLEQLMEVNLKQGELIDALLERQQK